MAGDVRFARIHGRIVPIRGGHAQAELKKGKKPTGIIFKTKPVSAGQRFARSGKLGAKAGAIFGAAQGAAIGAFRSPFKGKQKAVFVASAAVGGAISGAVQFGLLGGAFGAVFGPRHQAVPVAMRFKGKKK